jgi:predicted transcriptional regulator
LTQGEVAQQSGIPQANYSRIEQGKIDPRLTTLQDITRSLRLEIMLIPAELVATVNAFIDGTTAPEASPLFVAEPD